MSRIHRGDCLASQGVNFLETTVTLKTRLSVRQASRYSWTSTLISELFVCFLGLKLSDPDRHALIVPASGNAPKNLLIASWMRRQSCPPDRPARGQVFARATAFCEDGNGMRGGGRRLRLKSLSDGSVEHPGLRVVGRSG